MSQLRLSNTERIAALERSGYSEREARFLCLAGLHSGYFLRRQYCSFLGKAVGGTAAALIEKLLANDHATVATYAANTQVYHLSARSFYAALGQEDNRNRRRRRAAAVKSKLMALDFVLAHMTHEYLATEQEKVDYFSGLLRVENASLPSRRYTSSGLVTERYFVEKYPLFLSPSLQEAAPSVVSFVFIDEGTQGVSGFHTFLNRYKALFGRLREFRVIYVATTDRLFAVARHTFATILSARESPTGGADRTAMSSRIVEHFQARRLYEAQQWTSFDRARLIRLRDERKAFSGETYEALYRCWLKDGVLDRRLLSGSPVPSSAAPVGIISEAFSTYRLMPSYDFFGRLAVG